MIVSGLRDTERGVSLSGRWKARRATEGARRQVGDVNLDDSGWVDIEVPGLWRNVEEFRDADAVLYRHRMGLSRLDQQQRRWLTFDGLCYQGDVWFDGAYLGDTEGYFVEHCFEITDLTSQGGEHLLAIEATCAVPTDRTNKRNITGVLQHSDSLDQSLNPGGLWREVRVEETGPIRVDDFRVLVLEADTDRAIIRLGATLDSAVTTTAEVRTSISRSQSVEHDQQIVLARGRNEIEWHVAVERPELWWPWALGGQPLYEVQVEVKFEGTRSDTRMLRTGLRTFELRNWIASVNGERIFLKGTNFGPCSNDLSSVSRSDYRRDLTLAVNAGLDLVRVHGHIAHPHLYEEADELGILLFQDFPLQWGYARTIRAQAVRQATAAAIQLGHHPSIVQWSGHNEPFNYNHGPGVRADVDDSTRYGPFASYVQQVPSWNRSLLDRSVKRALEKADPTRPVIAHSGVPPHFPQLDGTDSHLWFGWRHGEISDLQVLASRLPRMLRFISEFGAQALPVDAEIAAACKADDFPNVARAVLSETFGAQLHLLERLSPLQNSDSWSDWVLQTQERQAEIIRHTIEILRTLKYRPSGGFCQFLLADAMPYVSCSLLDHRRRPKKAWDAMTAANRPVIAVADLHTDTMLKGQRKCAVHVVSDLRDHIGPATLTIEWRAPSSEPQRWTYNGHFDPDSVTKVAEPILVAQHLGTAGLSLELRGGGVHAINSYEVKVC
ncbi:MAG: hypothetical protein VX635_00005 [Actinomycetota bacterium]|nr:hypothetical protein [Actinomycetota bacterium]